MSLSDYRNRRGRAYRCLKCMKVDRRGRLVGHIYKDHVPFQRVPYYCTLCLFRCSDRQSLQKHITQYQRHREREALMGTPDYTSVLVKSKDPYWIGENDMEQLGQEESARWFASLGKKAFNMTDDFDGLSEDENEVVMAGGRAVPRWLVEDDRSPGKETLVATKVPNTQACGFQNDKTLEFHNNQMSQVMPIMVRPASESGTVTNMQNELPTLPGQDLLLAPVHVALPSQAQRDPLPFSPSMFLQSIANPDTCSGLLSITATSSTPVSSNATTSVNPARPRLQTIDSNVLASVLNTPHIGTGAQAETPLQDELQIQVTELTDPLYKEVYGRNNNDGTSPTTTKKQKVETTTSASVNEANESELTIEFEAEKIKEKTTAEAILEAANMICKAIEESARATRCTEKAQLKIAGELERIERKITRMERVMVDRINAAQEEEKRGGPVNKENAEDKKKVQDREQEKNMQEKKGQEKKEKREPMKSVVNQLKRKK